MQMQWTQSRSSIREGCIMEQAMEINEEIIFLDRYDK